ncbi:hypothetical protein [Leucobacter luti]|uniref:hypothetical protein n=1 Tax=Leucobacter luti TaxID=340320 RepID=UPI003D054AE0
MSTDPFEELFGRDSTEPQPIPARERLAHEQAERVRTAQLPTEKRGRGGQDSGGRDRRDGGEGRGSGGRAPKGLPWIVVGVVAVLAIVASIVTVNLVRAQDPGSSEATTPTPTQTEQPKPTKTPTTEAPEKKKEDPNQPPKVDVGPTSEMLIGPWNATSQFPQRLGSTSFVIPDNVNLTLSSDVLNSFPDSCADMREAWGAIRAENGTFQLRKPAERCAAAPELYDEVWGLLDAWVKTIKPL